MHGLVFDVHLRVARVSFVRGVVVILVLLTSYGVGLSWPTAARAFTMRIASCLFSGASGWRDFARSGPERSSTRSACFSFVRVVVAILVRLNRGSVGLRWFFGCWCV